MYSIPVCHYYHYFPSTGWSCVFVWSIQWAPITGLMSTTSPYTVHDMVSRLYHFGSGGRQCEREGERERERHDHAVLVALTIIFRREPNQSYFFTLASNDDTCTCDGRYPIPHDLILSLSLPRVVCISSLLGHSVSLRGHKNTWRDSSSE